MAPMDPQYVKALRDAKSLLDDGIFSEQEFEEEKDRLKQRFHVSQPGVSPAAPAAAPRQRFQVSQPGVSPAAPAAAPRKGMSDSQCRDPLSKKYLFDHRKCSKCPQDTCFWHISQFSPEQQKPSITASTRLCLQCEGSASSTFQTPTMAAKRTLAAAIDLCSPRPARPVLDALDIVLPTSATTGHGGRASLSGGPSGGYRDSIPAAIRSSDVSGSTASSVPGVRAGGSLAKTGYGGGTSLAGGP